MGVAVPLRGLTGSEVALGDVSQSADLGFEQSYIDVLAVPGLRFSIRTSLPPVSAPRSGGLTGSPTSALRNGCEICGGKASRLLKGRVEGRSQPSRSRDRLEWAI